MECPRTCPDSFPSRGGCSHINTAFPTHSRITRRPPCQTAGWKPTRLGAAPPAAQMAAVPQAPRRASAAPASPTPSECQREPGVSGLRDRSNEREFAAVADVTGGNGWLEMRFVVCGRPERRRRRPERERERSHKQQTASLSPTGSLQQATAATFGWKVLLRRVQRPPRRCSEAAPAPTAGCDKATLPPVAL